MLVDDVSACLQAKIKYTLPHLTINALTELTSSPKVELALASGYQNIVAGIETSYDTNKSDVTKWTAAAGLLMDDYQVCPHDSRFAHKHHPCQ